MRSRLFTLLSVLVLTSLLLTLLVVPGAQADTWYRIADGGISGGFNTPQVQACSSAVFNAELYVGTRSNSGCQVWKYSGSGTSWTRVATGGFGDGDNRAASSMCVFDDGGGVDLYVGTSKQDLFCEVYRYDGSTWTKVSNGDLVAPAASGNSQVSSLCTYNNKLYAGVANIADGCGVYEYSAGTWTLVNTPGFGTTTNYDVPCMVRYGTDLAVGTAKSDVSGFCILRYNGTAWTDMVGGTSIVNAGIGDADNTSAASMTTFGPSSDLWVGSRNANGGQIWYYDADALPPTWVKSKDFSAGNPENKAVTCLMGYGSLNYCLYAGTENDSLGAELWRDFAGWGQVAAGGGDDRANRAILTLIRFSGMLVLGTSQGPYVPANGCMVLSFNETLPLQHMNENGFAPNAQDAANCSASLQGSIYFGTDNRSTGGKVWRWNGSAWSDITPGTTAEYSYSYHNAAVQCMVSDGSSLYTGTASDRLTGGEVWRYTPGAATWECLVGPDGVMQLGADNASVSSMCINPAGNLVIGTANELGCEVWEKDDSDNWSKLGDLGLTNPSNVLATSMAVFSGKLYVGTVNYGSGCEIYRYDATWQQIVGSSAMLSGGFGDSDNKMAMSMAVSGSDLYVGTYNQSTGCQVWYFDGSAWHESADGGWDDEDNECVYSLLALGGRLYAGAGTYEGIGQGCRVQMLDGAGWHQVNESGFGNEDNDSATCLAPMGSYLYVGTYNRQTGFEVWKGAAIPIIESVSPQTVLSGDNVAISGLNFGASRGTSKVMFGAKEAIGYPGWTDNLVEAAVPGGLNGSVQVTVVTSLGTSNPVSITVSALPCDWYLAEGTSDWGFDTYVNVENPNTSAVTVKVTYMTATGAVPKATFTIQPESVTVFNPRDDIGSKDFSTKVQCLEAKAIAVDRRMLWTGPGAGSQEGHCSVGVTAPATTWYLPEGSSKWGFECWLLIQNPNIAEATCQVTYMIENAGPVTVQKKIPAGSRQSFNIADDIGEADASIMVTSNRPVIPERAMYRNNRREGHDSIGTTAPATTYYLAEGSSDWGFTTYVLVQNPNVGEARVTVTYMTTEGAVTQEPFTMAARSRKTINVNSILSKKDFSTKVAADKPIIAERAMYWGTGSELGEACHDSIGMSAPHSTFYLPDGETQASYETFTLVQNPNPVPVSIEVKYLKPTGEANQAVYASIPANSRMTFNMADKVTGRAGVVVKSKTAGRKIMVERAMYWCSRGAGTDTIGGYSN